MILKKLIIIFLTAFVTWGCGNSKEGSSENSSDENNETTDTPSTSENNATSTGTSSQTDEPRNWNELTGNEKTPDADWIKIENGTFTFGSAPNSPCRGAYAEEEVEVTLTNGFIMASTEITKAQWKALDLPHVPWWQGENKPVTRINFYEAALWCNKLSMLEGLDTCYNLDNCKNQVGDGCFLNDQEWETCYSMATLPTYNCSGNIHKYPDKYSCPGYRLPTSAEWEYAAKAGTETHTYAGDLLTEIPEDQRHLECPSQPVVNDIGWYCYNSGGEAQDVAQKQPNPWGLYDMLGNVAEIVDYHFNGGKSLSNDHPEQGDLIFNPTGPATGPNIEVRGRHFKNQGCMLRTGNRFWVSLTQRSNRNGFRPVRTIFVEGAEDDVEPDPEEDSEEVPEEDSEEVPNPGL